MLKTMQLVDYSISQAAEKLGVTPQLLRRLETEGRIPRARRSIDEQQRYGRRYSEADLMLLRAIGVGQRLRRLRRIEDVLEGAAR